MKSLLQYKKYFSQNFNTMKIMTNKEVPCVIRWNKNRYIEWHSEGNFDKTRVHDITDSSKRQY